MLKRKRGCEAPLSLLIVPSPHIISQERVDLVSQRLQSLAPYHGTVCLRVGVDLDVIESEWCEWLSDSSLRWHAC